MSALEQVATHVATSALEAAGVPAPVVAIMVPALAAVFAELGISDPHQIASLATRAAQAALHEGAIEAAADAILARDQKG